MYESQIFEKSILTKLGVPDKLMKILQKSFQFKYDIPKKLEYPTKSAIKKLLTGSEVFIFMINKESNTYIVLYRDGWTSFRSVHEKYTKYNYDDNGIVYRLSDTITHMMKDVIVKGFDVYTIDRKYFKGYRRYDGLESNRNIKLRDQKIRDFSNYFNKNTVYCRF